MFLNTFETRPVWRWCFWRKHQDRCLVNFSSKINFSNQNWNLFSISLQFSTFFSSFKPATLFAWEYFYEFCSEYNLQNFIDHPNLEHLLLLCRTLMMKRERKKEKFHEDEDEYFSKKKNLFKLDIAHVYNSIQNGFWLLSRERITNDSRELKAGSSLLSVMKVNFQSLLNIGRKMDTTRIKSMASSHFCKKDE